MCLLVTGGLRSTNVWCLGTGVEGLGSGAIEIISQAVGEPQLQYAVHRSLTIIFYKETSWL